MLQKKIRILITAFAWGIGMFPVHASEGLSTVQKEVMQNLFPQGITLYHLPGDRLNISFERLHQENKSIVSLVYDPRVLIPYNGDWSVHIGPVGHFATEAKSCQSPTPLKFEFLKIKGKTWSLCRRMYQGYLFYRDAQQDTLIRFDSAGLYRQSAQQAQTLLQTKLNEIKTENIPALTGGTWSKAYLKILSSQQILQFKSPDYLLERSYLTWSKFEKNHPELKFLYRLKGHLNGGPYLQISHFHPRYQVPVSCPSKPSLLSHPQLGTYAFCQKNLSGSALTGDLFPIPGKNKLPHTQISFSVLQKGIENTLVQNLFSMP